MVPIPTFPAVVTTKDESPLSPISNLPAGVVVPNPTLQSSVTTKQLLPTSNIPSGCVVPTPTSPSSVL